VPRAARTSASRGRGLEALRRGGAVSDLLFLYVCTTREVAQLRDIAGPLGLSVQAASHTFRGLARRGLAEVANGRYRATVAGVDFLHGTLRELEADLADRRARLHIVASTRAVAGADLASGAAVVLSLEDGLLTARPGTRGAARGSVRRAARAGDLVEVERLEGIVPLRPATIELVTVGEAAVDAPRTARSLAALLAARPSALLGAYGLEALHLARAAARGRPIVRFGVAEATQDASRLGVSSTVVVLDRDAPQLLRLFDPSRPPALEVVPLARRGRAASAP
jgi:predicted transcriptional regulator